MRDFPVALAVMSRAPSLGGKTRLVSALETADGVGLRRALLLDTLDVVSQVGVVRKVLVYTPAEAECELI